MIDIGCVVNFDDRQVIIWRRCPYIGWDFTKGVQESGLYSLSADLVRSLVHHSRKLCKLWHERLGHLHYESLSILKGHGVGIAKFQDQEDHSAQGLCIWKACQVLFLRLHLRLKE
jgi:hypothetical protein